MRAGVWAESKPLHWLDYWTLSVATSSLDLIKSVPSARQYFVY